MYFALLGKHKELSLKELEYAKVENLQFSENPQIVLFDAVDEKKLEQLAGIIKWGKMLAGELADFFAEQDQKIILWVADKQLGIKLKKEYQLKRFKQVDLFRTDLDVKNKGIELIKIWKRWGKVLGYQPIWLYELIDFGKPGRSMQMGMMPAKLTHLLLNIALSLSETQNPVIYDPFVGSGTTGFLANYFGLDFLGSDIKLWFAEQNLPRWKASKHFKSDLIFSFFEQDATKALDSKAQILLQGKQTLIVSEGWLGPIVKRSTTAAQIAEYQRWVKNMYLDWITQVFSTFTIRPVMVFTIPYYLGWDNFLEISLKEKVQELGGVFFSLDELYKRDQHKVARKVIIIR